MPTPGNWVLWSDPAVLAVNKPAGLRVIPDGYDPTLPTLAALLQPEWGKLWIVHRLDKDTSGVLLFARSAEAHRVLNGQFAQRSVTKIYHALTVGEPAWDTQTINQPLRINGDRAHRTIVDQHNGKPAQTDVRILRRFETYSLVEARPHSGYTHQIRTHLAFVGLPLLGDPLYQYPPTWQGVKVERSTAPAIQRTALHAFQIEFAHPTRGQTLTFLAPYPDDFSALLP